MSNDIVDEKKLATQRRTRRLRQRRLLHLNNHLLNGNGAHENGTKPKKLLTAKDLGWTDEEIEESYYYFKRFAPLWEGPGMDEYDELKVEGAAFDSSPSGRGWVRENLAKR
jgi:hypothetical protein